MSELKASGECCGVASEENQDIIVFDDGLSRDAKYIFCMDPLDGSSNIDVNVSIGTIFSVYRRKSPLGEVANIDDFLQQGCDQVAAGYVIYGSSTMLVYTAGNGVNGFTLDPSIGEFCLSHPNIKTPENGFIYSINEGNYEKFPVGVKKYIKYCQETDKKTKRPYTSRYIGSLVADFHRNLLKGGIFIYPETLGAGGEGLGGAGKPFFKKVSPPLPISSSSALTLLTNDSPGEHMPVLIENGGELTGSGGELRLMETDEHPGRGVHAALAAAHQTDVRRNRLLAIPGAHPQLVRPQFRARP